MGKLIFAQISHPKSGEESKFQIQIGGPRGTALPNIAPSGRKIYIVLYLLDQRPAAVNVVNHGSINQQWLLFRSTISLLSWRSFCTAASAASEFRRLRTAETPRPEASRPLFLFRSRGSMLAPNCGVARLPKMDPRPAASVPSARETKNLAII